MIEWKCSLLFAKITIALIVIKRSESGMDDVIYLSEEDVEIVDTEEYSYNIAENFDAVPQVAKPLLNGAKVAFKKIEEMLYTAPAFINAVKASVPKEMLEAVLTDEQKEKMASGALKLMTKKDGTLMANIVNPKTNKIVSTVPLKSVNVTPEISQAMTNYATQMQMAQIAEQIQLVQLAVEEVRQGQEFDRLAMAYSCQQKLIQVLTINNPELKAMALLRIALDAEDSRNLLMQSQNANVAFIKEQPESFWGKLILGTKPEKIDARMGEIRESLCAINMVSLTEAIAYKEMGENEAAQQSLRYYADYIQDTYLSDMKFVQRLDLLDPATENYWSTNLPVIKEKIQTLPCNGENIMIGENADGTENV